MVIDVLRFTTAVDAGVGRGATVFRHRWKDASAAAVAAWLDGAVPAVTVIACGERWRDGSLRPSLEDYLGAGAVISALGGSRSPEAQAAADAWSNAQGRVAETVAACVSGREAIARGWQRDVAFAVEVEASDAVPILREGAFLDARRT